MRSQTRRQRQQCEDDSDCDGRQRFPQRSLRSSFRASARRYDGPAGSRNLYNIIYCCVGNCHFTPLKKSIKFSKPDVEPSGPIVNALARGGLLQEVAGKEVTVLGEPGEVASHAPPQLGGGLGRNEPSVALRAWNDDGITHAI